jgi:hypothetical protein
MERTAVIEGEYRYELRRIWDRARPLLVVCMLNPSTANAEVDDPTILTLVHFAKAWGYGGLLIVNLFAYRSPTPKALLDAAYPVGPRNDGAIDDALHYAQHHGAKMLVAWGNAHTAHPRAMDRIKLVLDLAAQHGVNFLCLGTTISEQPKHPMARGVHRIPRDQQPVAWLA